MRKYIVSDLYYKIVYRLKYTLGTFCWRILLGHLGKDSYFHSGVKICGNPRRVRIGTRFVIHENCIIGLGKGGIEIGNNGLLGVGTYINCGDEKLKIGDGVAIAPFCKIFTYSHHYNSTEEIINSYKTGDVIIEDDVLIGTNTVILPGVTIGRSSVIAANSVVNKDVAPFSIVGGSPAKLIKMKNG
jgi:acetyltransferase-like isoleucine patch superfamily enzyme